MGPRVRAYACASLSILIYIYIYNNTPLDGGRDREIEKGVWGERKRGRVGEDL